MGALRLHRYLAAMTIGRSSAALGLLMGVYAAIDAAEVRALSAGGAGAVLLLSYPWRLPAVACHVLPLAATLGALLTLGALRRRGEWEALLGAGLGPGRVVLGLSVAPLLAAAAMAPLALELAPRANAAWSREAPAGDQAAGAGAPRWLAAGEGTLVRVERAAGEWAPAEQVELPGPQHRGRRAFLAPGSAAGLRAGAALRAAGAVPGGAEPSAWFREAGQSLPRAQLDAAIEARLRSGLDVAPLEAERALRAGLILACVLLPVFGLLLAAAAGLGRAAALAGLALALGAGYWLLTAVAWNGAAAGAWPAAWICPGVPAAFAVASAAILAVLSGGRSGPVATRP